MVIASDHPWVEPDIVIGPTICCGHALIEQWA